jgi:hypothetical protein
MVRAFEHFIGREDETLWLLLDDMSTNDDEACEEMIKVSP